MEKIEFLGDKDKRSELNHWIAFKGTKFIDKSPCLFCCSNGIFLKKETKIFSALIPMTEQYEEGKPKIDLLVPKIPYSLLMSVIGFFKAVYEEHKSEAIVLLLYSPETKTWNYHVPEQEVSMASAKYDISKEKDLLTRNIAGTIHSHASMGAFHSGVDDSDEENFDGIHMTIGKMDGLPEFACSVICNEVRVKVQLNDLVELTAELNKEGLEKVSKTNHYSGVYGKSKVYTRRADGTWGYDDPAFGDDDDAEWWSKWRNGQLETVNSGKKLSKKERKLLKWKLKAGLE